MENLLTVIVQTSPLPSHPSTALLEALFRSFDKVKHLKDCNIIILCDGACDEDDKDVNGTKQSKKINYKHGSINQDKVNDYLLHLDLLQQKIDNQEDSFISTNNGTIKLLKLPYRHGSARAIKAAFPIDTPYVLIAQHDNFFVNDVNYLKDMIIFLDEEDTKSWLHCIHFQSTATLNYVQKIKRRYNIDLQMLCKRPQTSSLDGELIPLVFWYGRTHIARTSYYSDKILCRELKQGDHLEELWGVHQLKEILELKKKLSIDVDDNNNFETQFKMLHAPYGNYVFFEHDVNGNVQQKEVLYHMNGRKVRATTSSGKSIHYSTSGDVTSSSSTTQNSFNPQANSFTIAKSTVAVVQGLEYVDDSSQTKSSSKQKKFKQNCFHCGEKGHSKKFCPKLEKDHNVTEIQHI